MQRNIILISIAFLILLLSGVVLFKNRVIQPSSTTLVTPALPLTTPGITNSTAAPEELNITVTSPTNDEAVRLPMIISGQARVFENQLSYRIVDENGAILSSGNTMANSPDMGKFGPYTITINDLGNFTHGKMSIEVFQNSARDGSEIDKVTIPVTLQ